MAEQIINELCKKLSMLHVKDRPIHHAQQNKAPRLYIESLVEDPKEFSVVLLENRRIQGFEA